MRSHSSDLSRKSRTQLANDRRAPCRWCVCVERSIVGRLSSGGGKSFFLGGGQETEEKEALSRWR